VSALVGMPSSKGMMVVKEPAKIGNRIRIAIYHVGLWRPIFWMRVARDGDIYLGLLLGRPAVSRFLSKRTETREVTIKYADAEEQTGDELPSSSRISFHPDGRINIGKRVAYGAPLAELQRPRQLCLMRFAHPARYRPPERRAPNDYDFGIVGYPVDEQKPMYGAVFVEPWPQTGAVPTRKLNNMTVATAVSFGFRGLKRTPDLAVQFVVGHGLSGPWPELPDLVVRSDKPQLSHPAR
jgi:hypothetical protein